MSLAKISGVVSGLQVSRNVTVSNTVATDDRPATSTTTVTTNTVFRIGNKPVRMNHPIYITNGDSVTVAGHQSGELQALALNNHTTKTMYWVPEPPATMFVFCVIAVICGIYTLTMLFGIFFIGIGIYSFLKLSKTKNAINAAKKMVA